MVLCRKELTAAQKTVLIALETFADYRTGANAHPGEENLATMTGLTPRAVRTALKQAREIGLIIRTAAENPKAGRAAVYRLATPTESATTGTTIPLEPLTTGTTVPVGNSTTGTTVPVNNSTTGTTTPHHRNGHVISTGTVVPPTLHVPPKYQDGVSDWGTSPGQLLADTHTDRPPSEFCDQHPYGYRGSCGPCANARTFKREWLAQRAERDVAIAQAEDQARRARRQVIDACHTCDDFGRLDDLSTCDHPTVPRIENAS